MSGVLYSPETKAAVMAALLAGQSVSAVAREFKIPKGTVSSWKDRHGSQAVAEVATQKKAEIGDLLVGYLRANLESLQAQAKAFGDLTWLKGQPASELAVLHGVMADKLSRLLEALGNGPGDE